MIYQGKIKSKMLHKQLQSHEPEVSIENDDSFGDYQIFYTYDIDPNDLFSDLRNNKNIIPPSIDNIFLNMSRLNIFPRSINVLL